MTRDEELTVTRVKELVRDAVIDFVKSVNHELAGDFYSVSNSEMSRYARMEKQLMKRISRRFRFRRMEEKDFGYLMEHLYGQHGCLIINIITGFQKSG